MSLELSCKRIMKLCIFLLIFECPTENGELFFTESYRRNISLLPNILVGCCLKCSDCCLKLQSFVLEVLTLSIYNQIFIFTADLMWHLHLIVSWPYIYILYIWVAVYIMWHAIIACFCHWPIAATPAFKWQINIRYI